MINGSALTLGILPGSKTTVRKDSDEILLILKPNTVCLLPDTEFPVLIQLVVKRYFYPWVPINNLYFPAPLAECRLRF